MTHVRNQRMLMGGKTVIMEHIDMTRIARGFTDSVLSRGPFRAGGRHRRDNSASSSLVLVFDEVLRMLALLFFVAKWDDERWCQSHG